MPMRHAVRGLLLHLGQHIADHFRRLIPTSMFCAIVPDDGDEAELWPGQRVIQVVFQKVVFGQVGDVAGLDGGEEVDVRGVGG